MDKYSVSPRGEDAFRQLIDELTGEIQIKKEPSESFAAEEGGRVKTPDKSGKNNRPRFVKSFGVGAHKMVNSTLFNRATRVLMYLQREAMYGGRVYSTVKIIASEIKADVEDIRKILRKLESEDFILEIESGNGTKCWMLNPSLFSVGGDEDEEIARRIWAKERTKYLNRAKSP